jgi:ribonucleoside-diphosphate reductase beta chain
MSVFRLNPKSHLARKMFYDGTCDIDRYDQVKYPQFAKYTDLMLSVFWRPQEVDLAKDKIDFANLSDAERFIFTSNIKRQIMLDSIQGRGVMQALGPIVSLPELETCFEFWQAFEKIHSLSYTHIIRLVYPNPSEVLDGVKDIKEIVDCAKDISSYYDNLIEGHPTPGVKPRVHNLQDLWLALHAINALEGIRFYVSFACSWAFAEVKKMEGNAKIIQMIARDENIHLGISTALIKQLPKDDARFLKVAEQCADQVRQIYISAVEQEKTWADYLFQHGSMIGLNARMLKDYTEWNGTKRMRAVGVESPYSPGRANPLPWTEHWVSGGSVQEAPQETEISNYKEGGGVVMDDYEAMLDSL